jgi:hypothetical protein
MRTSATSGSRLHVIATARLGGRRPADAPPVPGFAESAFGPLVLAVARRCLTAAYGVPPARLGPRTGVVLASVLGDTTTADTASRQLAAGRTPSALLFYQSVPNAILGVVSREFGITGPMTCVSGLSDVVVDALATAELMLEPGGRPVRQVLVMTVELAPNPRTGEVHAALPDLFRVAVDTAFAALVDRARRRRTRESR